MAGPYWHMAIADQIIKRLSAQKKIPTDGEAILAHPEMLLFGANAPDIHFYPGGDKRISDLAHGNQPAELGRKLISSAKTEPEKAFAYGWMSHIITDIVTHELVNRTVAERFGNGRIDRQAFSDNQVGHYRVEWGIDLRVLNTPELSDAIPSLSVAFQPLTTVFDHVKRAYEDQHSIQITKKAWETAGRNMIRYNSVFTSIWKATGRQGKSFFPLQMAKTAFYYAAVLPLMKTLSKRSAFTEASILIPLAFPEQRLKKIFEYTDRVVNRFLSEMATGFKAVNPQNLE